MSSAIRTSSRGKAYRVFFCVRGMTMVLLHGFLEKSQKTPDKEVRLARQRKRDWEKENE